MTGVTRISCVGSACGYDYDVSPPPTVKPHCPKCGGPTRLVTVGAPVEVPTTTVQAQIYARALHLWQELTAEIPIAWGDDLVDAMNAACNEIRRLHRVLNPPVVDPELPLGTDSVPVDDGTPPL